MSELKFLLQRVDKDEIKMDLNNYTCKLTTRLVGSEMCIRDSIYAS